MKNQKLKELRKAKGITQSQLAEAAGLKQQALSRYESGENEIGNMTLKTAAKITAALGIRIEEMM